MKGLFSIIITSIFLFSQGGFTVLTHYCGGEIAAQSFVLANTHIGCGMEGEIKPTCNDNNTSIKGECCKDEIQKTTVYDNFKIPTESKSFDHHFVFPVALMLFHSDAIKAIDYPVYLTDQPPKKRDISVLFQTFLI